MFRILSDSVWENVDEKLFWWKDFLAISKSNPNDDQKGPTKISADALVFLGRSFPCTKSKNYVRNCNFLMACCV